MSTQQINPNIIRVVTLFILLVIVIVVSSKNMFYTIEPGHKAVLFRRFGGGLDKDKVFEQGFHIIAPWNKLYVYDVRLQEVEETMDVLSSNGLSITIDVSIRYKPIDERIGYLHDEVGPEYLKRIIIPEIRSATRKVIGQYTPEELYSTKRDVIQTQIIETTADVLKKNNLMLDALLIRSVKLPLTIQEAIENKLRQEQEWQEYEFKIEKEKKEAERKQIEAEGIRKFQEEVSRGISRDYLKWKGIEATERLANSPNTKVIIIGNNEDGLPVILGGN